MIWINIECSLGSDIERVIIPELVAAATRLETGVRCCANGVTICAVPNDDAPRLFRSFLAAGRSHYEHKIAYSHQVK